MAILQTLAVVKMRSRGHLSRPDERIRAVISPPEISRKMRVPRRPSAPCYTWLCDFAYEEVVARSRLAARWALLLGAAGKLESVSGSVAFPVLRKENLGMGAAACGYTTRPLLTPAQRNGASRPFVLPPPAAEQEQRRRATARNHDCAKQLCC